MGTMFKKDGTLNFPDLEEQVRHQAIIRSHKSAVKSAFCPHGHDLMSSVKIDGYKGIHFIYREQKTGREAEIVITAIVGDCTKVYLSGEPFEEDEIVAIFCPTCRVELHNHGVCECGVHDYLFFLDEKLSTDCAQTFCSRIGCGRASKLHVSRDESSVIEQKESSVVIAGYCSNGHSLISDVKIDQRPGIGLIYKSLDQKKEAEIVISATVGETHRVLLKGEPFEKGERVCIYCPTCREELPILFDCKCGAPIYMFFLDQDLDYNRGQAFCSRVDCAESSRSLMSKQALEEFMVNQIP
jgi:hypothetical protein